jgi:hypothetical protein
MNETSGLSKCPICGSTDYQNGHTCGGAVPLSNIPKMLSQMTPWEAYCRGWDDRGATDATRRLEQARKDFYEAQYGPSVAARTFTASAPAEQSK